MPDYSKFRTEFSSWLYNKISEETANKYISLLDNYLNGKKIKNVQELAAIYDSVEKSKNNFSKAVRNFLNFLVERDLIDEGVAIKFKRVLPLKKSKSDKQHLDNKEVKEAFEHFSKTLTYDEYLVALLLLFSGMRLRQILRALTTFDKSKLYVVNELIARYRIDDISEGNKEGLFIYMPRWLAEKLYRVELNENSVKEHINYKTASGRTVSAKYIRKWLNNLMVRLKIEKDIRNFILGRVGELQKDVEADDYIELTLHADEEYTRLLENFPIAVPSPRGRGEG
ncbi:TPA_asm: integrase [Archaeoglobus veneficus pleomorphic virus 1]|uniref:Integrase n=1 Tax=Archaeoglobus veneficus pleomorphic virus 1 TaxID=3115750 RepID=A0AAT9JAQ7_9VIRU